jgi:hypothetical protein
MSLNYLEYYKSIRCFTGEADFQLPHPLILKIGKWNEADKLLIYVEFKIWYTKYKL